MTINVIKLQAPFERLKNYSDCPEVNLRRAIILQAVVDATNISTNREAVKYEIEAKEWLFSNNPHFIITCEEAALEPEFVVQIAKDMIALHKENTATREAQKVKHQKRQENKLKRTSLSITQNTKYKMMKPMPANLQEDVVTQVA